MSRHRRQRFRLRHLDLNESVVMIGEQLQHPLLWQWPVLIA